MIGDFFYVFFLLDRSLARRIEAAAAATGPPFLVEDRSDQILTLFTTIKLAPRMAAAAAAAGPPPLLRDRSDQILTLFTTIKVAPRMAAAAAVAGSPSPLRDRSDQVPTLTSTTATARHLNHELESYIGVEALSTLIPFICHLN